MYKMGMDFIDTTKYKKYSREEDVLMFIISHVKGNPLERIAIVEPDKGFIMGLATPFPFGPYRMASESAWWVSPEFRKLGVGLDLLNAFEYWAKEKAGCSFITMVGLSKGLDKLYNAKGYKLYEHAYMKVL